MDAALHRHHDAMRRLIRSNVDSARLIWGAPPKIMVRALKGLSIEHRLSVRSGDVLPLDGRWYVTHTGLLRLARRSRCAGISVEAVPELSDASASRWAFRATVYRFKNCKGFVGYGDAATSNVSPLVHGAEMRVAETRAGSRALRKAYGIGICSVEEIGSLAEPIPCSREAKKLPPQPVNGNYGCPKLRDRLCQLIRQHELDANLVKSYAVDFCGVKSLREATRAQVENFVAHLADWAEKDRDALLCQLNSYLPAKGSAA